MKIVDENGKLFKKFNLVDAIVILLVVVIIAALAIKIVGASVTAAQEKRAEELAHAYATSPHLVYDVVCNDIPEEVAVAFEEQMKLPMADRQMMSNGVPVEGYITGCTIEPHEEDEFYDVYFSMEAILVDKEGIYSVGSQEVRIGKGHIVKTYNIETSGYVYAMEVVGEVAEDE